MTRIECDKKRLSLSIKGHAGYAAAGQDVICAAVSILAFTLADKVTTMTAVGQIVSPSVDIGRGSIDISCKCREEEREIAETVFDTICCGFELLAEKHPEYVSYKSI